MKDEMEVSELSGSSCHCLKNATEMRVSYMSFYR